MSEQSDKAFEEFARSEMLRQTRPAFSAYSAGKAWNAARADLAQRLSERVEDAMDWDEGTIDMPTLRRIINEEAGEKE